MFAFISPVSSPSFHLLFLRYPPLSLWKRFISAAPDSLSFFLKCGLKQNASAAVPYASLDDAAVSPSEVLTSNHLPPRMFQLPCDVHLIAQSEDNFFCGADNLQLVGKRDCFVQVQNFACLFAPLACFTHLFL